MTNICEEHTAQNDRSCPQFQDGGAQAYVTEKMDMLFTFYIL